VELLVNFLMGMAARSTGVYSVRISVEMGFGGPASAGEGMGGSLLERRCAGDESKR
jgi:hypothetical protein